MRRPWARATLICGTLDIVYACVVSVLRGGTTTGVLRYVAAGPFGDSMKDGGGGAALLGLLVHFAIMGVMVAVYLWLYTRSAALRRMSPVVAGIVYGVITWAIMNCIVLALRYPETFPPTDPTRIAISLFPHIVLVGIPLAYMARGRGRLRA